MSASDETVITLPSSRYTDATRLSGSITTSLTPASLIEADAEEGVEREEKIVASVADLLVGGQAVDGEEHERGAAQCFGFGPTDLHVPPDARGRSFDIRNW